MIVSASFNDYLYILVGIVWLAFSVYKGQKKKGSDDQQPPKKAGKSFLDSLLEEFVPVSEPTPVPYVSNEATTGAIDQDERIDQDEKYVSEIFSYDDAVEESNETETSVVYREKEVEKTKKENVKDLKVTEMQKDRFRKSFSLRNAVIQSEILNPRYF